jgi:cytochrome c oxidase subunit 2
VTEWERDSERPVAPATAPEEDPRIQGERHPIGRMLAVGVVAAIVGTALVLWIDWFPTNAASSAGDIDTLYDVLLIVSVPIFVLVMEVAIYSVIVFRARPGDKGDGAHIHGNTKLEIVWTIVPTVLLAVMAVWAYLVLADNEALASDRQVVEVTAQQFAWEFVNREAGIASGDMRVEAGRQVELEMRSKDVIHDFYVKEFRVKMDVVPGITTRLVFNPDRPGTYQVICAELCGVGHGTMRARVIVMEPAAYQAWLAQAKRDVAAQPQPAAAPAGEDPGAATTEAEPAPQP